MALQRSFSQRQAMILDPGVSAMSWGTQLTLAMSGFWMGPMRMFLSKHSRIVEVSVSDFSQVYHKQASEGLQYFCWSGAL